MCCDWHVIEYSTTGPHVGSKVNMTPFSLVVITPHSSSNSFIKVQPGFLMIRMCEMREQSQRSPAAGNMPMTCEELTFKCQPHPHRVPLYLVLKWDSLHALLSQPPLHSMTWMSHLFDIRWVFISRSLFWSVSAEKKKTHTHTHKRTCGGEKPQGKELRCSGQALEKVSILLST